jgi:hypothetical protein
MDLLLDHFDYIPEELRQALCSNEPKDAQDEPT